LTISVGSSLGAYEITALLGEGGMGRVFRARDTRLKRDVAIKVLPDEFAIDAERTARFRREAEALAALNHPHIAGIHDVFESGGCQFLVLELVEGETLDARIRRGPVTLPEALGIARQIAEALEAAHERGIVHRDLKPANVKVTPDGRVKVLDFGLAKDLEGRQGSAASLTHSPTFVGGATKAGVILGTAAYMSPEQARGLAVGPQADVWALGCVLYEMLTGRQPFSGPTVTDVLAAVVRGDPDWSALPSSTPAALRSLLRRCLQKDLSQRLHHIADVRIDLEDVRADAPIGAGQSAGRSGPRWSVIALAGLGLIAVSLASAYVITSRRGTVAPELHVDIATPPSSEPLSIALSPDGLKIVYVATVEGMMRLVVRALADGKTQTMPGTELAAQPFWSPDSRSIGFFADGKMKRVDMAGGLTQTIAAAPIGGGGDWNRDGVVLFAPTILGGLFRVPAGGGEPVAVTRPIPTRQNGRRVPRFLSDGKHFVFFASGSLDSRGVYVGSLDGTPPKRLMDIDVAASVGPSDQLLFVRQGTLFAQQLRLERGELAGEPFAVANRVAFDSTVTQAAITAPAGSLAYRTGVASGQRLLVWLDRSGRKIGQIGNGDTAAMLNPELSADGRFVAVNRTVDNTDVWLIEAARGVLRRFSFDADTDQIPVWSPDGKRVVFSSNRKGAYNLYQKPADSPGGEEVLLETGENKFAMGFSADGKYLLYRNTAPSTNWDLWVLPLVGDARKPFPVVKTAFQEMIGEFSPDSHWIAYQTNESGQFEIYVQSFPEPGSRTQISTFGGSQPRWRRDGKELYYVALDGQLMAAPISVNANRFLETGAPVPLFTTRTPGGAIPSPQKQQYAVSSDGQRFLFNSLTDEAATSPISLVLNWRPPVAK
jgi:serine/threonine protein kinase/Tol biopolymer transport system component